MTKPKQRKGRKRMPIKLGSLNVGKTKAAVGFDLSKDLLVDTNELDALLGSRRTFRWPPGVLLRMDHDPMRNSLAR